MLKYLAGCFLFLLAAVNVSAQDTTSRRPADSTILVNHLHSDRLRFQRVDSVTTLEILAGSVALQQDNTRFYCDSAVINKSLNLVQAFGNVHINDADSVHIYGQQLNYHMDSKLAILKQKVKLTDGKGVLTTDELQYDTKAKTGVYTTGGKIVNGKTTITSKEATYYGELRDVYFKKDVKLRDPQYDLDADSLLYNTETQLTTFITKTRIKDSSGANIVTSEGWYDMKNRRASFGKRSVINDGKGVTITGDDIRTNDSTGLTFITGNGVYVDSVQKMSILANSLMADKKNSSFLATQHPLMIVQQDKDSIYISADTMFSAKLTDLKDSAYHHLLPDTIKSTTVVSANDSSNRYFRCFHHVRIFSDSLQAVCDSLFYSSQDSVFRMFNNPIIWASGSQVTGDTMYLFTRNKKPDRVFVFENSLAVNKSGEDMYNQISGRTLNGYFKDGAMDYLQSHGAPAQSVYYVKDDNNYITGVNSAAGAVIDMRFENKELKKVIFVRDVTGTMYPVRQIPEDKKKLRGFKWLDEKRPKSKFQLFENP